TLAGQVLDPGAALQNYISVFTTVAMWGAILGVAVLILSPLLGRLDRERQDQATDRQAKPAAGE
ncbi:MAG: hypothetical protein K8S25_02455, partial [Alphaproteobacteria bacterium]|nr:hypothetical protein [Alphaproteobacteria bacterium]